MRGHVKNSRALCAELFRNPLLEILPTPLLCTPPYYSHLVQAPSGKTPYIKHLCKAANYPLQPLIFSTYVTVIDLDRFHYSIIKTCWSQDVLYLEVVRGEVSCLSVSVSLAYNILPLAITGKTVSIIKLRSLFPDY